MSTMPVFGDKKWGHRIFGEKFAKIHHISREK
jgi:hypothetical protein